MCIGIGCTPFEAMFGSSAKTGLYSLGLPKTAINNVVDEDEIANLIPVNSDDNLQESCDESEMVPSQNKEIINAGFLHVFFFYFKK